MATTERSCCQAAPQRMHIELTRQPSDCLAELGRYRIRGFSQLRERPLPSFDDLTFLLCTLTRIPLEGYREKCNTQTVLGTRFATRPIINDIPVMISGMSFGALS